MSDLIEKLSDLRSQFNCFDENKYEAYRTLSEAIKVLSEQQEPYEDAVSRQAAYDALMAEPLKWDDSSVWESARCYQWMMDMDAIKALPSAQPRGCSDILNELKDDDYYNYIHTGHSRFSEDDWDYLIHNAKEKEELKNDDGAGSD